jgi:hypothetical protein
VKKNGGFAGGGFAGGASAGVMELGPKTIRALSRDVVNLIQIGTDPIANASRRGNANRARRGGK